jgi:hypothetical protein
MRVVHDEHIIVCVSTSMLMCRVTVVAREDDGVLLASLGNLLDQEHRLTLFHCTSQAFSTTVMECTYADNLPPIRHAHQSRGCADTFDPQYRTADNHHVWCVVLGYCNVS